MFAKKILILWQLFLSCILVSATKIDSLQNLLIQTESKETKTEILLSLVEETRFFDNTLAIGFAKKAYSLALHQENKEHLAESLYLLGRLSYSRSQYDSCLTYFNNGLGVFEELNNQTGVGKCLGGIGDYYYFIDEYDKAEKWYLKAKEKFEVTKNLIDIANIYISLGDLNYSIDNYVKAANYYKLSYPLYKQAKSKLGMATSINCMADISYEQEQYQDAILNYRKAKTMFEDLKDVLGNANCTQRIGSIHYNMNNIDSATYFHHQSLALYTKIGSKMGQAYSYRSLGMSHNAIHDYTTAEEYFKKSFDLFVDVGDNMGIANAHYHFGESYYNIGNFQKAIEETILSLEFAEKIGSNEIKLFSSELLAKCYDKLGDYKNAFYYSRMNKTVSDSLHSGDNIRKITQLQMQFQFDKETSEKEVEQLKKDISQEAILNRQKVYTYTGGFIGFVALLLAFIFFKNFKEKQKNNFILSKKNETIAQKNQDLTDSIEYAQILQNAILPQKSILYKSFPNSFIFYQPKDIVSGDFYWFAQRDNQFFVTASDCTGHGVPGAFMSLLGNEYLHQEINNKEKLTTPKQTILGLDEKIKKSLHIHEKHKSAKDGMDLALCSINMDSLELEFCGANNPLYLIRNGELKVFEPNKGSVGSMHETSNLISHNWQLLKGDLIYMFSDGYLDQFGGEKGKKFMRKRFQNLLLENWRLDMKEQQEVLNNNIATWMGKHKQLDDMLVIGIKI